MALQCKFITTEELKNLSHKDLKPGDMWYLEHLVKDGYTIDFSDPQSYLAENYGRDWYRKRPPICVRLPDGKDWVVDSRSTGGGGWVITGEVPNITASPSILTETYHGFLHNGVLSNDLEGRTYDEST